MISFNAVQNNTSLKQSILCGKSLLCFNAVQNNTSLKHIIRQLSNWYGFNAVQNNTSLKLVVLGYYRDGVLMQFKITHL